MNGTYFVKTFGCQMNKNDSERLDAVLQGMGLAPVDSAQSADVILLNTCSVRKSAEDRVFGQVHNYKKLKKKRPNLIIGVTGCMPGRDRDGALEKTMDGADLFFPIEDMVRLPEWISGLNPSLANSGEYVDDYLTLHPIREQVRQAYVTIQTGCNKFCTYCVVPFARGFERNRPVKDIVDEIRSLAERGCIEVTLLGQTVNSFVDEQGAFSHGNPYRDHFAGLLWEVNQIEGIERIHFTAPHPLHMTEEVIDAMSLPKHMNFLHLPVQAGDNDILRKMNRRYTREHFIELVEKIYDRLPGLALGTDIIVGYCGESEEAFERTVDLYKSCSFDISYTAMYSPRTGTVGHKAWDDDVSYVEKKRRWKKLQALMEQIVLEKNQKYVGAEVSVLADSFKKVEGQEKGWVVGNSREMKRVQFPGTADMVGGIFRVRVAKAMEWILYGKII